MAGIFSSIFYLVNSSRSVLLAVFAVLLPHIALAEGEKSYEKAREYIKRSFLYVFPIVGGMILLFAVWGPWIIRVVYGSKFTAGRSDITMITLLVSFYLTGKLANRVFVGRGSVMENFYYLLISNLVAVGLLFILHFSLMLRVEVSFTFALIVYNILLWSRVWRYYFSIKSNI